MMLVAIASGLPQLTSEKEKRKQGIEKIRYFNCWGYNSNNRRYNGQK